MTWQTIDGGHKIFTGSSESRLFVRNVPHAALAFCDPPYGVTKEAWDETFYWNHDYVSEVATCVAVTPGIANMQTFLQKTGMPYRWLMSYWIANGMTRGALGFGNWIPVCLFSRGSLYRNAQDLRRIEDDDMSKVAIKAVDRDPLKHKGRKPLTMMLDLIEKFTAPGDIVIDPFLGTGTTLIACQLLGRLCYGAEIHPVYVESILERYRTSFPPSIIV